MDKVIVSAYESDDGKEVEEHIIDVPTPLEIITQTQLNIANTAQSIRRKVLIQQNGRAIINDGLGL